MWCRQFCHITYHMSHSQYIYVYHIKKTKKKDGKPPLHPHKGATTPHSEVARVATPNKGGSKWGANHPPPQGGGHPSVRVGCMNHPFCSAWPLEPLLGWGATPSFFFFFPALVFLIYQNYYYYMGLMPCNQFWIEEVKWKTWKTQRVKMRL